MKLLLVVDMQNDFIDGVLGTDEAQGIVEYVQKLVQTFQGTKIFTKDTHDENYLQTLEGRHLPVPHCVKGTEGWRIREQVINELEAKVVADEKDLFSSLRAHVSPLIVEKNYFASLTLGETLKKLEEDLLTRGDRIEEIHLCGICTDICVISNAILLKAFFPTTEFFVYKQGCAGVTPELHEAAIKVMASCQVNIIE